MRKISIASQIDVFAYGELSESDRKLVDAALEAGQRSYAPYSHFRVGAAIRLANGVVLQGSNQENGAFPSGMCAERNVLFHAGTMYPEVEITEMAIVARDTEGISPHPCTPCGSCRQVMQECELRQGERPIRLILCGKDECYVVNDGMKALLPLGFESFFQLSQQRENEKGGVF